MTYSPTPEELAALKTANAALLASPDAYCDIASTIVFALGSAQLLQSPETALAVEVQSRELSTALAEGERLRARVAELEAAAEKVAIFCGKRAEYVTNLRNCSASNDHDYYRWTGHAEARRQLSQLLGLPVAWPLGDGEPAPPQPEDPNHILLGHEYATPHDLPPTADTPGSLL